MFALKDEMIRVIRGKSSIDRDMIQQLLDENQAAIQAAQDALTAAQNKLEEIEQENKKAENDCSNLFTWASTYQNASFQQRQTILNQFIKEVRVGRDYDIEKLAAAIRLAGEIKNPLRVHKTDIDEYEVNEGHRRRLATIYNVEQMGLKEFEFVPCVVEKNDTTIEKINLILSNSTQRERTEYEKMQEADKLRKLLDKYAKENETKISSTDMRKR